MLRGEGQYRSGVNFESAAGTIQSLEAAARRLDATLSDTESRLKANRDALPELQKASEASFPQAGELEQKRKRAGEIIAELSDERKPSGEAAPASAFREAWEVVDDESGVLKFREASAAKLDSHPERWTAERVGDATVKPLGVREVIEKYRKEWGFHVTIGHVRGTRGQYQRQETGIGSGGIRLKVANDLPVFIHELGHALDEKYNLTGTLRNTDRDKNDPVRLSKEGEEVTRQRIKVSQELKSNLDPQFAAQYKDNELLQESIAEFFRRFCQDRVKAASDYPETYRYVMTTLSGEDQARLLSMADEVNAVYSLGNAATDSIKHMDDKTPDYRGMPEKFENVIDWFIQKNVDSLYPVKKLSQMMGSDVSDKFYNAAYADSIAHFNLTEHLCDIEGKYVGPGLKTVLSKIHVNNAEEFQNFAQFLICRHGPYVLAKEHRVFANDRENNAIYMDLQVKELSEKYPEFMPTSKAYYQYWHDLMYTYGVSTGLISQDFLKMLEKMYPCYVSLMRVMDKNKGFGTHRSFANQPSPVKRQYGSGRDIIHPVESMINSAAKIIYQGIHNQAMLDLIDVADAYGLDAAFMERVPVPVTKRTADISGVKAELAQRVANSDMRKEDVETFLKILEEEDNLMSWYVPRSILPEGCIGVRRNGELEVYKVNDPLLFDALANMGRPYFNKEITKKANQLTRFVSSMLTGWNITWNLFSNAPRDLITALVYSTPENRLKLIPKIAGSWLDATAKAVGAPNIDPYYMEYLAMGGGGSSAWGMDTKLPKKVLSEIQYPSNLKQQFLDALQAPLKFIDFVSRTTEAGPRVATYELCREAGMEPQQAFRAAMEITVDFRKGGWVSRHFNVAIPFFNAGVQGMAKDVEALLGMDIPKPGIMEFAKLSGTDAPKSVESNIAASTETDVPEQTENDAASKAKASKQKRVKTRAQVVRGRWISLLTASLIGAAMEYALNNMTEERRKSYNRLSTYTKNAYFCIPVGDGKYFGFPKVRGITIPLNFFRALMERTVGGNRHAYDGFWSYAITAEFPNVLSDVITLNPSSLFGTVTILGPVAQIWANADFRGMPIESARDRKLSPSQRYTGSTSALAKNIGDALNLSPKQIDFLGNNTLGAPWQYQQALFPIDLSKRDFSLGVKNKYVKDSLYSQDSVNRLYDLAEKSSRDSMDDLSDTDSKVTAYFDNAMTDFYSRYNSIAKSEDDSGNSDRETRELVLTLIEDYLSAREDGTLTAEQKAVYEVCRAAGDTSNMLPSARQNAVKDGDGAVRNLTAAQYYDYQGNFNSLYWNLVKEALPQAATDAERESVLKYAVDAAGEMSKNNVLIKLGAKTTKEYAKYEDLQLYSVPISTYLVAKAKTKDIESLKDKRTGETISNSKSALVAEAVLEMNLDLPETNVRKLMEALNVGDTVRDWKRSKLERELKRFRKDAVGE